MLLKVLAIGFFALVFIGLGSSGTLNAVLAGYHTVTANPVIHQFQSKATNAIIGAANQFHNIESTAAHAIHSEI